MAMEKGQAISFIKGQGSPLKSSTLGDVAALLSADIPFSGPQCLLDTVELKEGETELCREHTWTFNANAVATFRPNFVEESLPMGEILRRFRDAEWCAANADHPIAYMRAVLVNRAGLVELLKGRKPLEKITRWRGAEMSLCLIPASATAEEREKMLADFEAAA